MISSAATAQGQLGSVFSYQITASSSPTSFNATGLPSGLSINTATGVITGTPTSALSYQVTVSATNSSGTGTAPLLLSVYAGMPVVTSAATASAVNGNGFTYQVTVQPAIQGVINLEPQYWQAPAEGTDSQAGTIVHETSHLMAGTQDYGYGEDALRLATTNPSIAIQNADNYEYYAEKFP